jgi:hypothetical protein
MLKIKNKIFNIFILFRSILVLTCTPTFSLMRQSAVIISSYTTISSVVSSYTTISSRNFFVYDNLHHKFVVLDFVIKKLRLLFSLTTKLRNHKGNRKLRNCKGNLKLRNRKGNRILRRIYDSMTALL